MRALGGLKDLEEGDEPNKPPLALQLEHSLLSDLDRAANEGERGDADQHLPRVRCLLQPRCHVHGVAGRQPLLGADQHLASVDPDPTLQAELRQGLPHSTAARHARSASSSCTTGTPNTAITASPMNFSTEPPCDSTIPFIRSK